MSDSQTFVSAGLYKPVIDLLPGWLVSSRHASHSAQLVKIGLRPRAKSWAEQSACTSKTLVSGQLRPTSSRRREFEDSSDCQSESSGQQKSYPKLALETSEMPTEETLDSLGLFLSREGR